MPVETKATKLPIQANLFPRLFTKIPTTPDRCFFPSVYSAMMRGMLQRKRKIIQANKNAPAPFSPDDCAAILGKRQMFPVPTAMPMALRISPHREEKRWSMLASSFFPIIQGSADLENVITMIARIMINR